MAAPSYAGAATIRRLLLVGAPHLGSMQPVLSHLRGEEVGLRKVPAEVVATIAAIRSSPAVRCSGPPPGPLQPGFASMDPLQSAHSVIPCEQHQFLTGNLTFENNLLHTLFERASASEERSAPGGPGRASMTFV